MELAAKPHELKKIHEEVRTELEEIYSPRVLFTHPHELDPIDISNEEVNLTKTMALLNDSQPSHPHHAHSR